MDENKTPSTVKAENETGGHDKPESEPSHANQAAKPSSESEAIKKLLDKIESLEKRDAEKEERLKMLYNVADKGRIFNYESSHAEKKPFRVRLSVWQEKIIVGWRVAKDALVKHPTTGKTVGEEQEIELLLLDKDGNTTKQIINGYPMFSDIRYSERIEAEVIGKKEDWQGNATFELQLPDGRSVSLDSRFVN